MKREKIFFVGFLLTIIPLTSQIHLPLTSQAHYPMSSQMQHPMTSQIHLPLTSQVHHPMTPQVHHPMTPQVHHPMTPRMHHPMTPRMHLENDLQSLMESRSFVKYIHKILSARLQYILCNKVTVFGMVICPYEQFIRVPEFSTPSFSSIKKAFPIDNFLQRNNPIVGLVSGNKKKKIIKDHQPKVQLETNSTIDQLQKNLTETETKTRAQTSMKRKIRRTCMEGKYDKELDKCLTFESKKLTYEDAEYFCSDLAPGGKVWNPNSNSHSADFILLKNKLTPVQYSIWINALHLIDSIVGEGLFDSHLKKALDLKPIRGTPGHKHRVILAIEENQPFYAYTKDDNLHSVICQTFPIFIPEPKNVLT